VRQGVKESKRLWTRCAGYLLDVEEANMKTPLVLMLLVGLYSSVSYDQVPTYDQARTQGMINGRVWRIIGPCKSAFVEGFVDGLMTGAATGKGQLDEITTTKFNYGEIASEIDKFYEETLNVVIPVPMAYVWVIQKLKGTDPALLEERLLQLRKDCNK
jgi:hypothetical protein